MASIWNRFLSRPASGKRRPSRPPLLLEVLEERCTPTTYNVNTTADLSLAAGIHTDGTIVGMGNAVTLRSAIEASNNNEMPAPTTTINLTVAGDYRLTLAPINTNVVGAVVANGGMGYTAPTVNFTGGGGAGAAGFATVNAAGQITSVTITNGGMGYTSAPMITINDPTGTGASATALVGEDDNLRGELAILPTGGALLIQNVSGGGATIDGNNAVRDFDVNPNFSTPAMKSSVAIAGVTITNGLASPNDFAAGSGGGVRDQGPISLTLNDDVITNNFATADGGGVSMENSVSTPWTLSLTSTIVSHNHAGDAGGGIETDGSGKVFINIGSTITANSTVNQGGGIWLDALNPTGATLVSATLNVTDAVVSDNAAYMVDGGIGQAGNSTVTITNSTVMDNFSGGTGGGYGDQNNQGTLVVLNSYFTGNAAVGDGGGIQEFGPSTTITNTEIKGNSSNASGGGVFLAASGAQILECTIADNTAAVAGGGLEVAVIANQFRVTNSTIAGNRVLSNGQAGIGGGMHVSIIPGSLGVVLLQDTINGNFADMGGGIYYTFGPLPFQVENTIVAQNSASLAGPDAFNTAGAFTDDGGNIIGSTSGNAGFTAGTTQVGVNPLLGPLGNNLGPLVGAPGIGIVLETEAIGTGSPAFDKGLPTNVTAIDERGFKRPDDGANEKPDVGAFDVQDAYVVATFPQQGVWRLSTVTGAFVQLGSGDASLLAVDANGDVAGEFPGSGVYPYTQSTGTWTRFTTATASQLAIDANGDVFAVLSGAGLSGLYRYNGSSLDQLSVNSPTLIAVDAGGDVAAEYPHQGVWRLLMSTGMFTQLTPMDASLLAIDRAGDVFADLAGMGVFRYTTAMGLQQIGLANATLLAVDDLGDLVADYRGNGLYFFTAATGTFPQIGTVDPNQLTMDNGGDVFAGYGGNGVYEFTLAGGFQLLDGRNASALAAS